MSVRPHPKQKSDQHFKDAWQIDYYDGQGKRRRVTYYGTEVEARRVEHSWRIKTRKQVMSAYPSLNEASVNYIEYYKLDHLPRGVERLYTSMKHILRLVGRYQFPSITPAIVEDYKKTRLVEGVKHNTINKELAALSGFCKWAEEQGYCEHLTIKRFPRKLTQPPLPQIPTRHDIVIFLRSIPRPYRGIFAAMYYCGLRSSEARGMRDEHIHWGAMVMIVRGKGNKQRVVPLNRKIIPYLRSGLPWRANQDLRKTILRARKKGRIEQHIYPHLLRHAFGVHMTMKGVGLRALQEMMGHSSSQVTEIYTTMSQSILAEEMKKF